MTEAPLSPLRRRMIEDITIRKFAPRTQEGYIRAVKSFSAFLRASPDTASAEDLRRYRLHLVASGTGVPTINHTLTALRFLFLVTLRKPAVVLDMPFVREPRRLPIVLSPEGSQVQGGELAIPEQVRFPPLLTLNGAHRSSFKPGRACPVPRSARR
jgi:integrase/recombinase XerD